MNAVITVKASDEDRERYQDLLRADWSRKTFDDVLSLLCSLVENDLHPDEYSWQKVLTEHGGRKSSATFDPDILNRIRDLSGVFREPSIPDMPERFPLNRPTRLAAQAEQAWAFLIVQAMATLKGATGLFADTQSLLFLCSAHFVLPQLRQQNLSAEHDCLVCAMYVHTLLVWKTMPAHILYLQGVLMDHLGNSQRQLELLDLSFLLTPPEDHSYLTRAIAYWAALMDRGQHETARTFLFSLMRHAPDSCQGEIRDMLSEMFAETRP